MPSDAASQQLGQRYLRSWEALGKMLEEGKSWSGGERNLCYLNDGKGRFTDISALAGFDHPSDSRAQAFTDWDGDGDLDVWHANRTAPRVRILLNQLEKNTRYVAFRLVGQTGNRDAIGARVTVTSTNGKRLLRTLRAGEGYLGQSSKVVHFGLPESGSVEVSVRWPGGASERFGKVVSGQTYILTEGGVSKPWAKAPVEILAEASEEPAEPSSSGRLLPHAKLPLPALLYSDAAASGQVSLIVLWASWCQPCLAEILALSAEADSLTEAGVKVCLVNIEDDAVLSSLAHPSFVQRQAGPGFLDAFDVVQRAVPGRERESVLPSSMLVSPDGELLALYKGVLKVSTVLEDQRLVEVLESAFRDHAVPFEGRWLTQPLRADLLAIPNRLLELEQTEVAFTYLERHVRQGGAYPSTVARIYYQAGRQFEKVKALVKAKEAYIRALQHQPRNLEARLALALIHEREQAFAQALDQFREILTLQPDHLQTKNSLAWLLATVPDHDLRKPAEAERLAIEINRAVKATMSEPLDTLAAAQAAGGKFAEAVATAQQALELAGEKGQVGVANRLRERLALYRKGKAYVQRAP